MKILNNIFLGNSNVQSLSKKNINQNTTYPDVKVGYLKTTPAGDSVSFSGRIGKIIETLQKTAYAKGLKISLQDAIKVYEKLGYSTTMKQGSHITIRHPNGFMFALKIPHGAQKRFIHPDSVKTLQCAVFDDFPQLLQSLHFHKA